MKEVIVHPLLEQWTSIIESPIPTPGPDEIVIKVITAASNPKDYEHLLSSGQTINSGDDVAGTVHSLGESVKRTEEFRIGDKVAGMHEMMTPGGAYAEYAVVKTGTTLRVPEKMSFEEAATIPLTLTTAALTLFRRQNLPPSWTPRSDSAPPLPLIVYGASSSLGTFAVKLAKASNIHPIIAIAGSSTSHLLPLLDEARGDALVDYRGGSEKMIEEVRMKLGGLEASNALDAITSRGTWVPISKILAPSKPSLPSYLSVVSGANKYDEPDIQNGVKVVYTYVGTAHSGKYRERMPMQPENLEDVRNDPEWVWLFSRYAAKMLVEGKLTGHPYEVVEGGLEGVEKGLKGLQEGKAKGVKFVYRIASSAD